MIRLIQFLIFGHWHKWKIIEKHSLWKNGYELSTGDLYYLQCEICGDVKSRRLSS